MTLAPGPSFTLCNPLHETHWEQQIAGVSGATIFHTTAWARVLHDTYGYTPLYLREGEPGNVGALLPMMEVNSWLTGRRGIALPFTDECGVLNATTDQFRHLFEFVRGMMRERKWKYFELRSTESTGGDLPPSLSFHGHYLELQPDSALLFSRCESSVRRAVRKAEQEGVQVEFSAAADAMERFYALLCLTRTRHGLPPQPYAFFENIHRQIIAPGQGIVALARAGDTDIAGAVYFTHGSTVLYKFGASDERHQQLRGNNLVMWRAIERFAQAGFRELDFGRTSLANAGLRRFKQSWGTTERRLDYLRYDARQQAFVTSPDESTGGWKNTLFRKLPPGISRWVGAVAYRHIA